MATPSDESAEATGDDEASASDDAEETIHVELKFYAPFKEAVGEKSVQFDLPRGATMADALARAVEEYPALEGKLLNESGQIQDSVRALHNGHARAEADLRLEDGDEVSFTTPIHGG